MNLARSLEKRLENLVDGASATVFRGKMHPVTIAGRLVRQLEFMAFETPAGLQIPNVITVGINESDMDANLDVSALESELKDVVQTAASDAGWRLVGPVSVHIELRQDVPKGILECSGSTEPGSVDAWAQLISDDGAAVVPLSLNRTLVGRALDCDVRLTNGQISRHHATIVYQQGRTTIVDHRSSNGTYVNGTLVSTEPAPLSPGSSVAFGDLSFVFRPVT
ncbi:MAG: FhaA domain-containing protein [Acidimicrobiia bacterium]